MTIVFLSVTKCNFEKRLRLEALLLIFKCLLLLQLKRLSSQVSLLQEDHAMQTDKQNKFREENKLLCTR